MGDSIKTERIGAGSSSASVIPPVGSIVAWLKSFTGTPALADGWVECNGQVLSDAASVYNGKTLPDLNNIGTRRFLRGNPTSGGAISGQETYSGTTDQFSRYNSPEDGIVSPINCAISYHQHAFTVETIPPSYSVVWIMRIK